jgi:hypothetical protein
MTAVDHATPVSFFASLASVRTWADFLAADGVTDVRERTGPGLTDPTATEVRVDFKYRGEPCMRSTCHYVPGGTWPDDPVWKEPDPRTAMVEKLRSETVAWVADWHKTREPVESAKPIAQEGGPAKPLCVREFKQIAGSEGLRVLNAGGSEEEARAAIRASMERQWREATEVAAADDERGPQGLR